MNPSDWTIGDWETAVIAFSSVMSVLIIWRQSRSMGEQNRIAKEQKESSEEIIKIELNRDRQANLVSAWISSELRTDNNIANLSADAFFFNSSKLPVYEVFFEITMQINNQQIVLPKEFTQFDGHWPVIAPDSGQMHVWRVNLSIKILEDPSVIKLQVSSPRISSGFSNVTIVTSGLLGITSEQFEFSDFYTIGVRVRFRCSDGSIWKRDEAGNLIGPLSNP